MLGLAILESLVMIAARGHHTTDVVANFCGVFFIYTVGSRWWVKATAAEQVPSAL